jgi:hypothetical protein
LSSISPSWMNISPGIISISQLRGHSGAPRSGEPGIYNHRPWLWIPGQALRAVPE